jgi:hypothetical protein
MSHPAGTRPVLERFVISRSVFCSGCAHSEFIHGDSGARGCLFSECGCQGYSRIAEGENPKDVSLPGE